MNSRRLGGILTSISTLMSIKLNFNEMATLEGDWIDVPGGQNCAESDDQRFNSKLRVEVFQSLKKQLIGLIQT